MNTQNPHSESDKKSRDPKAHQILAVNASGEVVGIANLQEDIEIDKIKVSSGRAQNILISRDIDVVVVGTTEGKKKEEFLYTATFEVGNTTTPTPPSQKNYLDVTTKDALRHSDQQPTERENVSVKEQNKGYSSVVEDQFTLAGTPRIRAPKGAGRKKKPISLTMYQSDIDDVTEAAKLLGYPNRTEYLETIIKKHAKRTLNELKPTP